VIEIGKSGIFVVCRETSSGYYLRELDSNSEVFMPPAMAPINIKINQKIEAFVYLDTKGGPVATNKIPYAEVGEYALMKVVDTQEFGAFFDWGIEKDLLVPGNEQKVKVHRDEDHVVRVCIEEGTERVYGTTKLGKYIEASVFDIAIGDKIKIAPVQKTDLGYRSIINRKFIGMIYANEIFINIKIGENYDGIVKKIREDGLVDASLQAQGIDNLVEAKDKILEMLEKCNGKSTLHDKSSPDDIKKILGMSKQTFKSASGMLYKERKIKISKDGIELIKK